MSNPMPPPSSPASILARPALGGPASVGADVFGPKTTVPSTPQKDNTSKRNREDTVPDTPMSTTSSVAAGASPRKKGKARKSTTTPAIDYDAMGAEELRAAIKVMAEQYKAIMTELRESKAMTMQLLKAFTKGDTSRAPGAPKQAAQPPVVAAVVEAGAPAPVPVPAPAPAPPRLATAPAPQVNPVSRPRPGLMSQEEAWTLVQPRGRRGRTGTASTPSGEDAPVPVYVAVHRTPTAQLRRAFQAFHICTSLIEDYAFVRENTLQVLVFPVHLDRLVASFKNAKFTILESFDPSRPSSPDASEDARSYAWSRMARIADSGIAHGKATGRDGVVSFYEEWKRREAARGPPTNVVTAAPSSPSSPISNTAATQPIAATTTTPAVAAERNDPATSAAQSTGTEGAARL